MVGTAIRRFRQSKNISVKQLTEKAKITRSMLSQIENNKANPSLKSLMAIAAALGVHVSALFEPETKEQSGPVVREGQREVVRTKNGITFYSLTHRLSQHSMGFFYEVYEKKDAAVPKHSHEGEECGLVLEGKLEITHNNNVYILNAGDSIVLDSSIPHRMRNLNNGRTVVIWVDVPPSW